MKKASSSESQAIDTNILFWECIRSHISDPEGAVRFGVPFGKRVVTSA